MYPILATAFWKQLDSREAGNAPCRENTVHSMYEIKQKVSFPEERWTPLLVHMFGVGVCKFYIMFVSAWSDRMCTLQEEKRTASAKEKLHAAISDSSQVNTIFNTLVRREGRPTHSKSSSALKLRSFRWGTFRGEFIIFSRSESSR